MFDIEDLLPSRLIPRIEVSESGCWVWTGANNGNGYGCVSVDGRRWSTHRYAYEFFVGPIPPGLDLDHLCRVRECCNPAHLEPVTRGENVARGDGRARTHCPKGHPYDDANTGRTTGGWRRCLACHRARQKARYVPKGPKPPATACRNGHPYVEGSFSMKAGYRRCLICHRESARRLRGLA